MATRDDAGVSASQVREWIDIAEGLRRAHLDDVERVQAAAEAGLRREVARRTAAYGAGAQPTLEGQARVRAASLIRSEIRAEVARIDVPTGRVPAGSSIIHGRVLDRDLAAVPGANVAALDEGGATVASDLTDRAGAFRIEIPAGDSTSAKDREGGARVGVLVTDATGGVLSRDPEPSLLPAGALVYRDVVVEGAGGEASRRRVYHVTARPGGGWIVRAEGATRATSTHATKEEAVARGRELAKSSGLGQLIIHRKDGRIETEYTYGEDPRESPG